MSNNKFPECVYHGEFHSSEYGNLPAYLPASQGGFCVTYNADNEQFIHQHIEKTVLCLFEDTPVNLLNVHIFDFANRPNFPFLSELKQLELCDILLNEQSTINTFNELEKIIQHRYHTLFSSSESNLDQYNARSQRPEIYHVLIINTACFPSTSISAQRLQNFVKDAYGAGIYIIALHNPRQFDQHHSNPALDVLIKTLPSVQITLDSLNVAEDTLPVQKMADLDFSFTPADINQSNIIEQIQKQLQTDDNNSDTDFLQVKIGTQPNGDDAYLSLGKASMNYHALLLGISGSGKSTLMNNVIMQISKKYHAHQIRLYLMDYKQGVEFNKFTDHPNVEKVFLASNDISAGVALLEQVKADINQRYQLFKSYAVEDIDSYNQENTDYPLPHILLMIDEFHKLLQGDFRHNEYVNTLLEDVAKLGRGAGVHLWLSTQSLKDVNFMSSVKDQISLRMTYRVANEGALGFDNFDSSEVKTIVNLAKYEVFIQNQGKGSTAFVDKPLDIEKTIQKLRLSRPAHLQVQSEVITSEPLVPAPPQASKATLHSTHEYAYTANKADYTAIEQVVNPHQKKFSELDSLLAHVQQQLQPQADGKDDVPDWMKDDNTADDTPDWMK